MSSECDFINRELSENTSSASTTDKAARGTSRGARPDPTRIAELAMHVTIARTPAAVMTRRTVPAQRRTRTAPVVVAASSPEGVPKMAPDERRRAPAAVATAAAAIVASTVVSPSPRTGTPARDHAPTRNPGLIARTATIEQTFLPRVQPCVLPIRMKSSNPPLSLGIPPIIVPQRGPHLGVQRERHRLQGRRAGGGPSGPAGRRPDLPLRL